MDALAEYRSNLPHSGPASKRFLSPAFNTEIGLAPGDERRILVAVLGQHGSVFLAENHQRRML